MAIELPIPIAAYFALSNARKVDACVALFTGDAVVFDEGRERRGPSGVRAWMEEVIKKYRPTADAIRFAERDGRTIVTASVSGDFPGSPIKLRYEFSLAEEKIARLEIRL